MVLQGHKKNLNHRYNNLRKWRMRSSITSWVSKLWIRMIRSSKILGNSVAFPRIIIFFVLGQVLAKSSYTISIKHRM